MKFRIIKLIISIIFFALCWLWRLTLRLIGIKQSGTFAVLYYHSVTEDQRNRFIRQMNDVIRYSIPVPSYFDGPIENDTHYSIITFDDGFISVIVIALPVLVKRNIPLTIFVPTGYLGKRAGWINNEENNFTPEVIVSDDQLKELKKNELVTIGSHCVSHYSLLLLEEQEIRRELKDSRHVLEEILEEDVKLLSFPHGDFNQRILDLAFEAGYKRVFSILPKLTYLDSNSFIMGRVKIDPTDWVWEFRLKMLGAYRWLPLIFRLKARIKHFIGKSSSKNKYGGYF